MTGAATLVPASVLDHPATPEWDTSTAHDLCDTCGWPVERKPGGPWAHESRNPVEWTDKRGAVTAGPTEQLALAGLAYGPGEDPDQTTIYDHIEE